MTTPIRETPRFLTTTRHAGLRAAVILGLCAALLGGFVAASVRAPGPAGAPAPVACGTTADGHKAC